MRKKLLFVTAALGYGIGGSEKALIEMLKCLDLSKYDITVLSLNERPEKPFYKDGIKVIYGYESFLHISTPIRNIIKNVSKFSISEILTKIKVAVYSRTNKGDISGKIWDDYKKFVQPVLEEYDVVFGYGLCLATYFAVDKVKAKKIVLWMDTDLALSNINLDYNKKYYECADGVVVVDKSQIERTVCVYPKLVGKVSAIRNIIPFEEIIRNSKKGTGFDDGYKGIRILSVGRLSEEKKFSLAVDAAAILRNNGYLFRWYIIGFGPDEQNLREQISKLSLSDYVILLGQQTNPYPYFAQTDLYVQTSIFEGSCITIEEAMVFYKPVVSTNFPPAYNKIEDGKNGFIVNMDASAIAEKIQLLLDNKSLREEMTRYQQQYPLTYDEIINDFDNLIDNIT